LVTAAGVLASALALGLVVPVAAAALAGVLDELDGVLLQAAAAIAVTVRRAAPTVYRALFRTLLIGSLRCCKMAFPHCGPTFPSAECIGT
jgi:hypothetical protein